jgi:mannose-6-phosphate isomerase-like protein (cupin superfamily)
MYKADLKQAAEANTNFRTVMHTGKHSQLVAMNIKVGEEIGMEVHPDNDQVIYIVDGTAEATVDGEVAQIDKHDLVFVEAGSQHNFRNTGNEDLKIITIYAPAHHPDSTVHVTKADAEAAEQAE